ncbi:MAG: hypothetical protein DWG76_01090 [Chloroflexi bacterium]|nr:hypothetical protein [Chloroflexota bacterium]MQC26032.1 hypothetical protein [Chloroflexota bacterium]
MTIQSPRTIGFAAFAAVFGLALVMRFAALGAAPLTELEANQALQAHDIATGVVASTGDQPAYVLLTALNFALIGGSTNFLARFWPAVLGSLFVLLPYALRENLGRVPALLLALALAVAPEFVTLSRFASGIMLGIVLPLFALLAWHRGSTMLAGVLAAFALLSEPTLFVGLLSLALAWLLLRVVDRSGEMHHWATESIRDFFRKVDAGPAWMAFGATLAFGVTVFLSTPCGFSGIGSGLAGFVTAWFKPARIPASYLLLGLLGYSLPAIFLGGIATFRAWKENDRVGRVLAVWAIAGLIVIFLYPGRQVHHLLWVSLPLWTLVARELASALYLPVENRPAVFGASLLFLLVSVIVIIQLSGAAGFEPGTEPFTGRLAIAGIALLVGALALVLIALGWSGSAASQSARWTLGVLAFFLAFTFSSRIQNRSFPPDNTLLTPGTAAGQTDLLLSTLTDLSIQNTGQANTLEILSESRSFSLRWALRNWPLFASGGVLASGAQPAIILTDGLDQPPALPVAYRGQDFVWTQSPSWTGDWPDNLIAWLLFRQAPVGQSELGLWARADLFPGVDQSEIEVLDEGPTQ